MQLATGLHNFVHLMKVRCGKSVPSGLVSHVHKQKPLRWTDVIWSGGVQVVSIIRHYRSRTDEGVP